MNTRQLLVSLGIVALFANMIGTLRADDKPWTGEQILPLKPTKDIKFRDGPDDSAAELKFSGKFPLRVREDKEGKVRVHDGAREGWVDKSEFILVRDAPAYFDARIRIEPNNIFLRQIRATALCETGKFEKAIEHYSICIQLKPNDYSNYVNRGNALSAQKEYDKAIEAAAPQRSMRVK